MFDLNMCATGHYRFVPDSYRLVHKGGLPHGYHYYRVYISLLTTYLFSRLAYQLHHHQGHAFQMVEAVA